MLARAQRSQRLRFGPLLYVTPMYHLVNAIEIADISDINDWKTTVCLPSWTALPPVRRSGTRSATRARRPGALTVGNARLAKAPTITTAVAGLASLNSDGLEALE